MRDKESLILSCIVNNEKFQHYLDELRPEYFTDRLTNKVFNVCIALRKRKLPVDILSVTDRIEEDVSQLLTHENIFVVQDLEAHIDKLIDNYKKSTIRDGLQNNLRMLDSEPTEGTIGNLKEMMTKLDTGRAQISPNLYTDYGDFVNENLECIRRGLMGYSWGIGELDYFTKGVLKGRMYVLGGLKKSGKTRFMVSIANHLVKHGKSVLIISLEMAKSQLFTLFASNEFAINSKAFFSKEIDEHKQTLADFPNVYRDRKLYIENIHSAGFYEIASIIKEYKKRLDIDVVFIDFFQKIILNGSGNRADELSDIAYKFSDLERELDIALVVLSQLNNEAEREDEPNTMHIKGSGGISEACDTLLLLNNKNRTSHTLTQAGTVSSQDFSLIIDVQRDGESGVVIPLLAQLQYCHFNSRTA